MYSGYSGLILVAYLLYLFLTRMELFLIISFMLESFSIISQSLTLSNRLSINILAGSLSISSLLVVIIIFSIYLIINSILIILLLIIYSFEILNSFVQLFIFNLLSIEYLLSNLEKCFFIWIVEIRTKKLKNKIIIDVKENIEYNIMLLKAFKL